jgi:hypothetical protein
MTGGDSAHEPVLVIIRGNSASGKSTVAAEIRRRRGRRDVAIVGQDYLRRNVLRERDVPGGANIGLSSGLRRRKLPHGNRGPHHDGDRPGVACRMTGIRFSRDESVRLPARTCRCRPVSGAAALLSGPRGW